jgi:hypothetical protein
VDRSARLFSVHFAVRGAYFGLLEGKEVIITAALMRGDTEHGPWVTNQKSANSSSK